MKSRQIMFFLVLEDIEQILRDIEITIDIQYCKMDLFDCKNIPIYNSVFDTPNLGVTFSGDWNRIDAYLIVKKSTPINIRDVPQRAGGTKFLVDQMTNPKSIELKVGGIYEEKENVIVAGRVATISVDDDSNELYKLFITKIKKEFKKIGSFYVGKKAEEKLKLGWRLVTNDKLGREYDLPLN